MSFKPLLALLILGATPAFSQVQSIETPGNLLATVDPGCIAINAVGRDLTPADMALGLLACVDERDYDAAMLFSITLRVNAVFDSKRVTDRSAHGAGQAISVEVWDQFSRRESRQMSDALDRFGATGSTAHGELCATLDAAGPPTYVPTYMIQHGMQAIIDPDTDVLVANFDPVTAWDDTLTGYLQCKL